MPRALMISPEAPYPLDGGGALRTASLLQYLAARFDLDLIAFEHPGQHIAAALPGGLVSKVGVAKLRPHSNSATAKILRNGLRLVKGRPPLVDRFGEYADEIAALVAGQTYDLVVLEHFWCAPYAGVLRNSARRLVIDLHNIESEWHAGCAQASSLPASLVHCAFAAAARREEKKWLPLFDLALVTSEQDAARCRAFSPRTPCCVYRNAIPWRDSDGFSPEVRASPDAFQLAFSGNLEYEPNRTALTWFLDRVWPSLKTRFPGLLFRVVGKNAHAVQSLVRKCEGVECTGWVEDVFPHLNRSDICIAPLRSGSGTRLKIIEAWAARRAVVSTRIGAEGLEAVDGESILLADTASLFAEAIARLLLDPPLRARIANQGRALFEQKYTWNQAWSSLTSCLGS